MTTTTTWTRRCYRLLLLKLSNRNMSNLPRTELTRMRTALMPKMASMTTRMRMTMEWTEQVVLLALAPSSSPSRHSCEDRGLAMPPMMRTKHP